MFIVYIGSHQSRNCLSQYLALARFFSRKCDMQPTLIQSMLKMSAGVSTDHLVKMFRTLFGHWALVLRYD